MIIIRQQINNKSHKSLNKVWYHLYYLGSYGNLKSEEYVFHDDFIKVEPIPNRNDYVKLSPSLKRVVLKPTDNEHVVETTNAFEDSSIQLFMVCGFTNWKPTASDRNHCKNTFRI